MQAAAELISEWAEFAEQLADAAGTLARCYFRTELDVQTKPDRSPVTVADQAIETHLRAMIAERFPEHGLFGEEHGLEHTDREFVWVLDPIDGTKSFISGMPTFGTLIALVQSGQPIIGLVDMPALHERWVGLAGSKTTLNGASCRTRPCRALAEATLYATSPYGFADASDAAMFDAVRRRVRLARFGGDCYSYALVASGWVDVVMEAGLKPYDYLALVPVIEAAGGVITDWSGERLGLASDGRVIAAGSKDVHREVIAMLHSGNERPAAKQGLGGTHAGISGMGN